MAGMRWPYINKKNQYLYHHWRETDMRSEVQKPLTKNEKVRRRRRAIIEAIKARQSET
jgi:hypothetical protein